LLCRREFRSIARLYPIGIDSVVSVDFDPYTFVPIDDAGLERTRAFVASLAGIECSLFVSAELAPTWLTTVCAAALSADRSVRATTEASSRAVIADLLERLGLAQPDAVAYSFAPGVAESKRYAALLAVLGIPPVASSLSLTAELRESGRARFADASIPGVGAIACFPCGNRSVRIKQWPLDRFADALALTCGPHDLAPLVVGDASDLEQIAEFVAMLNERGVKATTYIAQDEDVAMTAAVIANAHIYLGNDTGLSHLASAVGVAGVTVYGGGTWPSFAPWAPGSTGVVQPLPCFGCGWDCAFGRPLCLDYISTADVVGAVERTLKHPRAPHQVAVANHCSDAESAVIGAASSTYRRAEEDRHRRYDVIVQLRRAREKAEARVDALESAESIAKLRLDLLMEAQRDVRELTVELERWRSS
jgi:ADP-heptose:LPS heptosyltransferase